MLPPSRRGSLAAVDGCGARKAERRGLVLAGLIGRLFLALAAAATGALAMAVAPPRADAHPHVFVEAREEIVFDDAGKITAIRHVWRFDDAFSAYATQGFDVNRDRVFSMEELQPLAQVNVESLKEYHYFTYVDVDGKQVGLGQPSEYWLQHADGLLTLFYTLPLAEPLDPAGHTVRIDVYDPQYYVAVDLVRDTPFTFAGAAPKGCTLTVKEPEDLDPMTATQLALIPPDTRELPENLRSATRGLANSAIVKCPERPASVAPPPAADAAPRSSGGGPFGVAAPEAGGGVPTGALAVVAAWQQAFYTRLTAAVKALKTDGGAVFLLVALSFAYGVFHAAGPGHGKAVISAYLLANEASVRRAVGLSFLSALLQAVVAIAIVGIAAVVLGLTSLAMNAATRWVEVASYSLVVLLGISLVWRKIVRPAGAALATAARRPQPPSAAAAGGAAGALFGGGGDRLAADDGAAILAATGAHFAPLPVAIGPRLRQRGAVAEHVHGAGCGCEHAVPASVAPGWRSAAAAVVSAGSRPCTGALVVLVFALSQGLFAAGVLSALAMAVGTGLTVTALALLAVGAKGAAGRLLGRESRAGHVAHHVLEGGAALAVLLLGTLLLAATFAG